MNDFSSINLLLIEKLKLFSMRFKREVTAEFLGKSCYPLSKMEFIKSDYSFVNTEKARNQNPTMYSLTNRYYRYCVYRREKFFDGKVWPFVISVAASVVTSILTTLVLLK